MVSQFINQLIDEYGFQEQFALEGIRYWADCFSKEFKYTPKLSVQIASVETRASLGFTRNMQVPQNVTKPNMNDTQIRANAPKSPPQKMTIKSKPFKSNSSPNRITSDNREYKIEEIDNGVRITQYIGKGGDVVVPSAISGASVKEIGRSTFYLCRSLKRIIINDGITGIGKYAFSNCTNLLSVSLPNSVTSIGYYAFEECRSLTSIFIPASVSYIGTNAFIGCKRIKISCYIGSYAYEYAVANGIEVVEATQFVQSMN